MTANSHSNLHHFQTPQYYYDRGLALAVRGQLDEAVHAFKQSIRLNPDFADAYFNLGIAQITLGRVDAAIENYHICLRLQPDHSEACYNLANAYMKKGTIESAIENYRLATKLNPAHATAFHNLAIALNARGDMEAAARNYEQTLRLRPDLAQAHYNLGALYLEMNRPADSIACYQNYLQNHPFDPRAYNNLGNAYFRIGKTKEALSCYHKALQLKPDYAGGCYNMANALQEQGRLMEALSFYKKAWALKPDWAELCHNMGTTLQKHGQLNDAVICFQKALEMRPDDAKALNNLGIVYRHQGHIKPAVKCYQTALRLQPTYREAHSNLLFCLNYDPAARQEDIFDEACKWRQHHGLPPAVALAHRNTRDPRRPLKIGYVSPDFRQHSVSFFFLPLIAAHHRDEFEVFCYAEVKQPDEISQQIKDHANHWYSTVGQTDRAVAEKVNADQIDILIDLAGHTADNRLGVFAIKPAPIQVTWLGYPNTTGLTTIDYRITDNIADPPKTTDHLYSEALIRLSPGFLCYRPPEDTPDVCELPSRQTGRITFGSFNALPKINADVIAGWSEILHQVSGSCLLLKCKQLADASVRKTYLDALARHGIGADRVRMLPRTASLREHLGCYHKVDIGLDPFPYNGTTTTCEALWMGVPVVTLKGDRHAARVGASILSGIGLAELIADSSAAYIHKAVELASDPDRLHELHSRLRERITSSPIFDARGFAAAMETAYRKMWHRWCRES